jgi:hypothetical protein
MNRNLVGSILGRSSIKIAYLVPIRLQTWPPQTILVSDWLISKKSSPLKLLCQMNRNLVESILGRSSIKIADIPYSPNGKRKIRDPFKDKIDRSRCPHNKQKPTCTKYLGRIKFALIINANVVIFIACGI